MINIDNKNEFKSEFDPLGSYTGTPFSPSFEESALAEMEVPLQDSDDL
ncbi:MAG: hypothetical protein FWE03_07370 [Firmicutes bacterium]|nr:hypothetical protein [Bacillota bacterium]